MYRQYCEVTITCGATNVQFTNVSTLKKFWYQHK